MDSTLSLDFDFISCITTNLYFKLFVITILGLTLTFINDVTILHNKYSLLMILLAVLVVLFTQEHEFGTVVLLIALFVLALNMTYVNHQQQQSRNKFYIL